MDIDFLWRFGRAMQHAWCMIRDRGFDAPDTTSEPFEIVGQLYTKSIQSRSSLADNCKTVYSNAKGSNLILVCFDRNYDTLKCKSRMISTDQVKAMQESILKMPRGRVVCLAPNKLSPQAKKEKLLDHDGQPVDIFLFDELMIDLPRHELVCAHRPVQPEAVKKLLGQTLVVTDLPQLPRTDPIAKWFGFSAGTIVQIDNPVMPSWRIVV